MFPPEAPLKTLRATTSLLTLALMLGACEDDPIPPIPDLGTDAGSDPLDAGVDLGPPDLGPVPCDGPPGLYVPDTGCEELVEGVMPFEPQFVLWTDDATKERFVYLPAGTQIDTSDPNAWVFPVGTKFFKTFSRDGVRLETRVITKTTDANAEPFNNWTFVTYGWNQAGDDVTLVGPDGIPNVLGTTHDIPSQEQCQECHMGPDFALGFDAIQLNHSDTDTTLASLIADGWLTDTIELDEAVIPGTALQQEALGYLHANCGGCHNGPSAPSGFRMRLDIDVDTVCETSTYVTGMGATVNGSSCDLPGVPANWTDGNGLYNRFEPGDADTSAAFLRLSTREGVMNQMPPIGTEIIHPEGVALIEDWIDNGI